MIPSETSYLCPFQMGDKVTARLDLNPGVGSLQNEIPDLFMDDVEFIEPCIDESSSDFESPKPKRKWSLRKTTNPLLIKRSRSQPPVLTPDLSQSISTEAQSQQVGQ